MSVKASGGNIWSQDKAKVKLITLETIMLAVLFVFILCNLVLIFLNIKAAVQGNNNIQKSSDKDSSLSTQITHFKDIA